SALFGHKTPGVDIEPITGQAIETAQRRLTGQHTENEVLYSSFEHFVRSVLLGPFTGVKNTISTFSHILPYIATKDIPKIAEALGSIKQGWKDSMLMGVN